MLRILMLASLLLMGASILIEVSAEQWYETLLELISCSVFVFVLFISSEFLSRSVWLLIGLLFIIISSLFSVALELEKLGSYIGVSTTNAIAVIDALYVCGLCLSTYGLHQVVSYYITQSYYDELTGLCNRRRLNQFEIHTEDDCLIYIDLDGLKSINDQSGHDAGDDLIVEFANLLKSVPDVAECFRVGGDEFIAICKIEKKEEIVRYLKKKSNKKNILFSYGYSSMINGLKQALVEADQNMYLMKKERK